VPGPRRGEILTHTVAVRTIKEAKRPLFIVGSLVLEAELNGESLMDYAIEIAKDSKMPTVAVAHTERILGKGVPAGCEHADYKHNRQAERCRLERSKGRGQHDLVVFLGVL